MSDSCIKVWEQNNGEFYTKLKELRTFVKKLLKLRNQLLTKLNSMQDYFWENGIYLGYTKHDIMEFNKFCNDIKGTKDVSIHSLWQLKAKSASTDTYEDDELTEELDD